MTGARFLDCSDPYEPPAALTQFLAAGGIPICVGFGSMTDSRAAALTQIVFDAIVATQQAVQGRLLRFVALGCLPWWFLILQISSDGQTVYISLESVQNLFRESN
jgi:hypothetical protein